VGSLFFYIVLFFFSLSLFLPVSFKIEAVSCSRVKKGSLLHHNDTQVIVCMCVYVKTRRRKEEKKVSYFNFVVLSRSARMPTTTACVHALPHLIGLPINFESSSIVRTHVFLFYCIFLIYLKMLILFYAYLIRVSAILFGIFFLLHS